MKVLIVFLLLVSSACSQNFCDSFCECTIEKATCSGVPVFPTFEDPSVFRFIDISSSTLRTIPNLNNYFSLIRVTFTSCPFLTCEELKRARIENANIFFFYDKCDALTSATTPHPTTPVTDPGQIPTPPLDTTTSTPETTPVTPPDHDHGETGGPLVISYVSIAISVFVFVFICVLVIIFIKRRRYTNSFEMQGIENPIYRATTTDV